jgi:preprotein translocase subunit YajC
MPDAWINTFTTIGPLLLILGLWYFLLRRSRKDVQTGFYSKSARQAVRDELAPELQALRDSIEALRKDFNDRR